MAWDGKRWKLNAKEAAMAASKLAIRAIPAEAEGLPTKRPRPSSSGPDRRSHAPMSRLWSTWPQPSRRWPPTSTTSTPDPLLVNCANGILSLHTGELFEHSPDLMLTHLAGAAYRSEADCPRWLKFLKQVQPDPEIRAFLQRAAGYSLTGLATAHALLICHGGGANFGKNHLPGGATPHLR